jgi:RNA polymerase sigma-70 factor (ECF subfamily)
MRSATAPLSSNLPMGSCADVDFDDSDATAWPAGGPLTAAPALGPRAESRLRRMVDEYFDFVWRSLRRLGVSTASVDDAAQRVFLVVAQRIDQIEVARERAFLFGVAVRVASDWRRGQVRRREVQGDDEFEALAHPQPGPEELLDQKRARETLDALLDELPLELRTVIVLIEGEGLRAGEAADILGLAEGTVSSRLRRARAALAEGVHRLQKRNESRRGRRP